MILGLERLHQQASKPGPWATAQVHRTIHSAYLDNGNDQVNVPDSRSFKFCIEYVLNMSCGLK